jgi:hypothetical protein
VRGALLIWLCSLAGRSLLIRDRESILLIKVFVWAIYGVLSMNGRLKGG